MVLLVAIKEYVLEEYRTDVCAVGESRRGYILRLPKSLHNLSDFP